MFVYYANRKLVNDIIEVGGIGLFFHVTITKLYGQSNSLFL